MGSVLNGSPIPENLFIHFMVGSVLIRRALRLTGLLAVKDVVCLKMMKDVGFDDHDLPLFTRSASRREARRVAEEHLAQNPEAVYAILAMKAFCYHLGRCIPGYFLNHFARRVQSDPDVPRSSSAVFREMVVYLVTTSFCLG